MAKDLVHAMIGYLEDAFLVSMLPITTESERRRNSNPRKVYPVDPGLIGAFDASRRANVGHALETVVFNALAQRKAELGYVKTEEGFEVDFHASYAGGHAELIQVCADPSATETQVRELRALAAAAHEHRGAVPRLLVLTSDQVSQIAAPGVQVQAVYEWLLAEPTVD